jgi:hypothetical protein
MHKQKTIYLFILIIMLLLAACSPAASYSAESVAYGDTGGGYAEEGMAFEAPAAQPSARDYDESAANTDTAGDVDRLVIKNAELEIAVEDPLVNMDAVVSLAEELGGYVVSSNLYYRTLESGVEVPQGYVTIRVPAERFEEALDAIKVGAGRVLTENVSGQDVTQEYTDLRSRLVNLQAAEAELQRIMEEATKTEDVLNVYNQLIYIREQIEVIQGRIKYFEQSAAFSAISVGIFADEAVQPLTIGGWEPVGVAKDAIQALINTAKFIAEALIWIAIYVLPVVAILYLVVFLPGRWLLRKVFKRKPKTVKAAKTEE